MIDFSEDQIDIINDRLISDLKILRELFVMDYSLLLLIINMPEIDNFHYDSIINLFGNRKCYRRIFKSVNGKFIYILGIIDYLQVFNLKKFLENKYKSILYNKEIKTISAVDPTVYSDRILKFVQSYLLVSENKNKLENHI